MTWAWFTAWRKRRICFHHDPYAGNVSFLRLWGHLDYGRRRYDCLRCKKIFIT